MHTQTLLDSVGQLLQVRCLYVLTISSPCAHPAALPRHLMMHVAVRLDPPAGRPCIGRLPSSSICSWAASSLLSLSLSPSICRRTPPPCHAYIRQLAALKRRSNTHLRPDHRESLAVAAVYVAIAGSALWHAHYSAGERDLSRIPSPASGGYHIMGRARGPPHPRPAGGPACLPP